MNKLIVLVGKCTNSFWVYTQVEAVRRVFNEDYYNLTATNYTTDINNQTPNNYGYDGSGNMIRDSSQGFFVSWSPYGKILTTNKAGGANLQFAYNAMQQRVVKRVSQSGDTTRTYYIRDAQGNTMGVYTRHNDSVSWREQYIFGSTRLGLYRADTLVNKGLQVISKLYEGKRNYELTNHLGNVLAVINDRKTDSLNGTVKVGFNAVVISATDYFPFGMTIDSRSYTAAATYRYGFNGKENDKETGEQDYGMRIYDPRIAKFLSVDPIANKYPELTPYQFASNTPIQAIDLDGLEKYSVSNSENNKIVTYSAKIAIFTSRETGGNAANSNKIIEDARSYYNDLNLKLLATKYPIDFKFDKLGNVTTVGLGSLNSDFYTFQFDVQYLAFKDENDPSFKALIKEDQFAGVDVFGEGRGKSVTFDGKTTTFSSETTGIITLASTEQLERKIYGRGKEVTSYPSTSDFNFTTVTHENGHKFGLSHIDGEKSAGNKEIIPDLLKDQMIGPKFNVKGQYTYDNSGLMRFGSSTGSSTPKDTQVINMLLTTPGELKK